MALILECMVIMHWLEEKGLGPVGLTGYSMGGHVSLCVCVCVCIYIIVVAALHVCAQISI